MRRAARARGRSPSVTAARWFAVAVALLVVALCSPLATTGERLFSAHMLQHLVLVFAVAPALVLAAPVTLVLQATAASSRRSQVLPLLRSRLVGLLAHPVFSWLGFAVVMYVTHFSPLYDAALRSDALHGVEHLLYLSAAVLFWLPVIRRDPVSGSFPWPGRLLYLFLALPLQSLLGLAIYSSNVPLYPHYLSEGTRAAVLADQHLAGAIMWVGGDLCMLAALLLGVAAWARAETRAGIRADAQLDAALRAAASAD
ncbi:MAG: cytochrome c oxidase assembly protein [Frankia sp.]|nr:cytochrome c oxidase assembly protein [Frankia sp.]